MGETPPDPPLDRGIDPHRTLDYAGRSLRRVDLSRWTVGKFLAGIGAGIAVSCVVYGLTLQRLNNFAVLWIAIAAVLVGKIVLAYLLIRSPRWSPLGKGIIGSSALIVLLIGACFGIVLVRK